MWAVVVQLRKKNGKGWRGPYWQFFTSGLCSIYETRREALAGERRIEAEHRKGVDACKLWFKVVPVWVEGMPMHGAFTLNLKDEAM